MTEKTDEFGLPVRYNWAAGIAAGQWWSMATRRYHSQIGGVALVGMRSVLECASQFGLHRLSTVGLARD
jgi:hypothetical protein